MKNFLFTLPLLASAQAVVQQTNCPRYLDPNTIVVAQSVASQANYPVIVLACYQLNASNFSVTPGTPGSLPVLNVTGAIASGAAGPTDAIQINAGSGIFGYITSINEALLDFSDVLTWNVSTLNHGLTPKLSGVSTQYFSGIGTWIDLAGSLIPAGTLGQIQTNAGSSLGALSGVNESYLSLSNVSTWNATIGLHGFLPTLSGISTQYLNGNGGWATPPNLVTSGASILAGNGLGGFYNVTLGSNLSYTSGVLNAVGGGASTTGSSLLYGNGFGGFSNATIGANLSFIGGTLAATVPSTSGTSILYGNGSGGFLNASIGTGLSFVAGTLSATGGGGGGGYSSYEVSGTFVGTRSTLNFVPGSGIVILGSDTGTVIDAQIGIDSGVVPTLTTIQATSAIYCASSSGSSSTYTCAMSPTLSATTVGQVINWVPDVSCTSGTITLTVDTFGPSSITQPDGATAPGSNYFLAGRMYSLWFDGSVWRFKS